MFPTLQLHLKAVSCANGEGIKKLRTGTFATLSCNSTFRYWRPGVGAKAHGRKNTHLDIVAGDPNSARGYQAHAPFVDQSRSVLTFVTSQSLAEFAALAMMCSITDERELSRTSRTLHELGSLVHFESDPKLSGLVILSPKWLTEFMATVLTTTHNFAKNGILRHTR